MYTIQFLSKSTVQRDKVLTYLTSRMEKEGIFRAGLTPSTDNKGNPTILVKPVRLIKAKPYCGQHANECVAHPIFGFRKILKSTYLEWNDWIKFHNLVNGCLNRFRTNANVWTNPQEVRGKFWIRQGLKARVKYDVKESYDTYGRRIQDWNLGTSDQFMVDACK